ncbi:DMT family transporter [Primorskyibacter sp. S187A]|uniref:DMT family transporter n=1 Tax=Primorskyibacter sp. S187A TaxID=3415130 RepID=UPI003C7A21CF
MKEAIRTPLVGAFLVIAYTAAITMADAMTKHLAIAYEAPQVLMIVSAAVVFISMGTILVRNDTSALRTKAPRAMALRSGATVVAAVLFYYAFALLPFADVFLFIGMVPILAGLMSAPVLREKVSPATWVALCVGAFGVYLLFPGGHTDIGAGHIVAFGAAAAGTFAIVMSRYIARIEDNAIAQVFYPQLAVFICMLIATPFVWQPMSQFDLSLSLMCGITLFGARYALALAMQSLPAYAATPLINVQFVWMVVVGMVIFHEVPAAHTVSGAVFIVLSGLFLVYEQKVRATPARRETASTVS